MLQPGTKRRLDAYTRAAFKREMALKGAPGVNLDSLQEQVDAEIYLATKDCRYADKIEQALALPEDEFKGSEEQLFLIKAVRKVVEQNWLRHRHEVSLEKQREESIPVSSEEDPALRAMRNDPALIAKQIQLSERLAEELNALTPLERRILKDASEGRPVREIAVSLAMPKSTVHDLLLRTKRRLAESLSRFRRDYLEDLR